MLQQVDPVGLLNHKFLLSSFAVLVTELKVVKTSGENRQIQREFGLGGRQEFLQYFTSVYRDDEQVDC